MKKYLVNIINPKEKINLNEHKFRTQALLQKKFKTKFINGFVDFIGKKASTELILVNPLFEGSLQEFLFNDLEKEIISLDHYSDKEKTLDTLSTLNNIFLNPKLHAKFYKIPKIDYLNLIKNLELSKGYSDYLNFNLKFEQAIKFDLDFLLDLEENINSKTSDFQERDFKKSLTIGDQHSYCLADPKDDIIAYPDISIKQIYQNSISNYPLEDFLLRHIKISKYKSIKLCLGTSDLESRSRIYQVPVKTYFDTYISDIMHLRGKYNIKIDLCSPVRNFDHSEAQINKIKDVIDYYDTLSVGYGITAKVIPYYWFSLSKEELESEVLSTDNKDYVKPSCYSSHFDW